MDMKLKKIFAAALVFMLTLSIVACGGKKEKNDSSKKTQIKLDPDNPVNITVWNYYNGDQLVAFENLVSEFNETVGADEGIIVVSVSQGNINNLAECLMDAVNGKTGAQDVPTLASVYAETGYDLMKMNALTNLDEYFTKDELDKYVDGFIQEGRLVEDDDLLFFPVSKSTECFAVNTTDWETFENATGIKISDIDSIEKLTEVAEQYYIWTDSLTPDIKEDGKALYGRDSIANYIYIGTKQLGHEMFKVTDDGIQVDLDKDTFKKLWDNYYIPFINGYFTSEANFRSEDMKTGKVLAITGSTSGVSYLPSAVTDENDVTHDIKLDVSEQFMFKDAVEKVSVQQGAGYCVMKSSAKEQYAAVEFLKWFTAAERNLEFSVSSGYSPVTKAANNEEKIEAQFDNKELSQKEENTKKALLISSDIYTNKDTYTCKPFERSKDVRDYLENSLDTISKTDRAAVVESINAGATREEAVSKYSSDEYFEVWYDKMCEDVNELIGK